MTTADVPSAPPHRRRRPRAAWLVLLVVLALTAWVAYHLLSAGQALQRAASDLRAASVGLAATDGLRPRLEAAGADTASAVDHLGDPVVRLLAQLPVVGDPVASVRATAGAADTVVRQAALPLLRAAGDDPADRLLSGPGSVDVAFLAELRTPSARAAAAVDRAAVQLEQAPTSRIDRIEQARTDLQGEVTRLAEVLDNLTLATDVGPGLLGKDRPQRYLVISQSPAEARGTGGLIGGYTLLQVSGGKLEVLDSGPRSALASPGSPVVDLGPEFESHYGINGAASGWINSNLSPHFPYAGRIWQELWERQHGERLDGALVLDPVALSYLLEATGPVALRDGSPVTSGNVVDLTLRDVYARFDDDAQRDAYLQEVAGTVTTALTTAPVAPRPLVEALSRAVEQRRLLLWVDDQAVQQRLAQQPISGTLPVGGGIGDVVVDTAGSKLDYYLDRKLEYRPGCGRMSRLVLTLTNRAPASGLPEYVSPAQFRVGRPPGTNKLLVTLYAPAGSRNLALDVDGKPAGPRLGTELGLVWAEQAVTIEPGASVTLELAFLEEGVATERIAQPLVRPEAYTTTVC